MERTPKRLLVADDFCTASSETRDRSDLLRETARALSQQLRCPLEFLYVEKGENSPLRQTLGPVELELIREDLQIRLSQSLRSLDGQAHCRVEFGSPAEVIFRLSLARPTPECLVLGTAGRIGLRRLWLGSVSEEVLRHSHRPVLIVGPQVSHPYTQNSETRILLATDLSKNSRLAENYALSLARRIGANRVRVMLFHCFGDTLRALEESVINSGVVVSNWNQTIEELREDALNSLKKRSNYFKSNAVKCDFEIDQSIASSSVSVPKKSQEGFDLLIMGTHGRSRLATALFGSTARQTLLLAPVPVIVVRSKP